VDGSVFDELAFFGAVARCGARALLIGRRALVALGLPVLTRDYDYWVHGDDVERFNEALAPFDLVPNHPPAAARARGRYVLENDERVDVLLASSVRAINGDDLAFADAWSRRRELWLDDDVRIWLPSLADLITTKRFGARPKDAEDIRMLELLRDDAEAEPPARDGGKGGGDGRQG
jgi:hypothetical protein